MFQVFVSTKELTGRRLHAMEMQSSGRLDEGGSELGRNSSLTCVSPILREVTSTNQPLPSSFLIHRVGHGRGAEVVFTPLEYGSVTNRASSSSSSHVHKMSQACPVVGLAQHLRGPIEISLVPFVVRHPNTTRTIPCLLKAPLLSAAAARYTKPRRWVHS